MIKKLNKLSYKNISVRTLTALDDEVFQGNCYSSKRVFPDLPTGGKYFLFVAQSDNYVVVLPPTFRTTDGPCIAHFYSNHDYSGGSAITTFNRLLGGDGKQSSLYEDPTGTDVGDCFSEVLFGTTRRLIFPGGGSSQDSDLLVLEPGDSMLLYIENVSGATIDYINISLTWYEK